MERIGTSPTVEQLPTPKIGGIVTTSEGEQVSPLNIIVIFTFPDATIAALRQAGKLAESLGGRITLVVPQIVPYPLPLTSPPVLLDFQENRFRDIAAESPVDVIVQLYLCRDEWQTLKAALKPHSLVVIGLRKTWWRTRERILARNLRRAGHEVVVVEFDLSRRPTASERSKEDIQRVRTSTSNIPTSTEEVSASTTNVSTFNDNSSSVSLRAPTVDLRSPTANLQAPTPNVRIALLQRRRFGPWTIKGTTRPLNL